MKIVFIQTYPAYHDFGDAERWLALENRDKWMPGIVKELGHEAELWCVANQRERHEYTWKKKITFPVRTFRPDSMAGKTKKHQSHEMVQYANTQNVDLYVLKGTDGGIGVRMLRKHILPKNIPFSFVIGGKWYSPFAHRASSILYETEQQRQLILKKNWKFWKKTCNPEKLIHLPKSIDTEIFKPQKSAHKKYQIISMGRLIPYYKNYDALTNLPSHLKIGFIGGGPQLESFRNKFPHIDWIGAVSNRKVPKHLSKASAFFYTGLRDHFPRVIAESAACGLPVIAFKDVISSDTIPDSIGLRVSRTDYISEINAFCSEPERVKEKGKLAREHAISHWNKESSREAIQAMIELARS